MELNMSINPKCDEAIERMGEALFEMDLEDSKSYADFLAQTFYYVSHSTRFLAFAAGLMKFEDRKFFNRFVKHISEEHNHELLAKNDLKYIGYEVSDFEHTAETRMLWESQYYKIQHEDPLSLIGYIIPLELFSAKFFPTFLKKIDSRFGKMACNFVKVHAEEDQDHIEEALSILNEVDGLRKQRILENVEQTAIAYTQMLDKINLSLRPGMAIDREGLQETSSLNI